MHMCKILIFQLRIFVACVIALPSRAKDDSMGRMPLRAPKVLQLSRNPRTWKSLGVLLLRLHVFTFFFKARFNVSMSSGVLLCYVSVEKYIPNESLQFEVMISFFILVPCAFQCPARWNRFLDFPQHG